MTRIITISIILILLPSIVSSLDVDEYYAKAVDISKGDATAFRHEEMFLGFSCKSGPIGKLNAIKKIKLGDEIKINEYRFNIGIIKVTKYNEDFSYSGKQIAKKGDTVCVMAADEDSFPSDNDCDALWIRVVNCSPIE